VACLLKAKQFQAMTSLATLQTNQFKITYHYSRNLTENP